MFILYTLTSSTGVGSLAEVSYLYPLRTGFKIINIDAKSRHCESAFKCRVEDVSKRSMLEKTIRGSILIFFFFFWCFSSPLFPLLGYASCPVSLHFLLRKVIHPTQQCGESEVACIPQIWTMGYHCFFSIGLCF